MHILWTVSRDLCDPLHRLRVSKNVQLHNLTLSNWVGGCWCLLELSLELVMNLINFQMKSKWRLKCCHCRWVIIITIVAECCCYKCCCSCKNCCCCRYSCCCCWLAFVVSSWATNMAWQICCSCRNSSARIFQPWKTKTTIYIKKLYHKQILHAIGNT